MSQTKERPVNSELNKALEELGITGGARDLYQLSLSLGPASIQTLATHLKLQRPYIYTLIQTLREAGLAPSAATNYQKKFVVESPSVLLDLLRKKRTSIETLTSDIAGLMPKLLAGYKQGGAATQVMFYEGREKFMELYDRVLEEEGSETVYFGEAEHFLSLIGEVRLEQWIARRIKKEIVIKTLMIDSKQARRIPTNIKQLRQTKVLDKKIEAFPASFQVFGHNVIFWQPHTPMAVVLQDAYIAQLMRGIFTLLWKRGKTI